MKKTKKDCKRKRKLVKDDKVFQKKKYDYENQVLFEYKNNKK